MSLLTNKTDDLDLLDAGLIDLIKYCFGIFLDQWIWEYEKIDRWEGTVTVSERRILITHLLEKAF